MPRVALSTLLLLAGCLGLAGVIYLELHLDPVPPVPILEAEPAAEGGRAQSVSAASAFRPPPQDAFAEIVERPLFSEGRRPPPAEAMPVGLPANLANLDRYVLIGILIKEGERVALLETQPGPTVVAVKEGEKLEGWQVIGITPNAVQFRAGDMDRELLLLDEDQQQRAVRRPGTLRRLTPQRQPKI